MPASGSVQAAGGDWKSESAVAPTVGSPYSGVDPPMTQKVDAIYADGVLKPTRELSLKHNQRVRLTVETIDDPSRDRQAAIGRLKAGMESMCFFSDCVLPSREELHDRR